MGAWELALGNLSDSPAKLHLEDGRFFFSFTKLRYTRGKREELV